MSDEDGSGVADHTLGLTAAPDVGRESLGRPELLDRWVAAAAYTHPIAAHIARAKLEFDGFESYLDNELFVTTAWLYSVASGGVKLMVRESDVAAARESLREKVPHAPDARPAAARAPVHAAALPAIDDIVCRHCGSADVAADRPWKRLIVACLTMIAVDGVGFVLLGPLMIGVALRSLVAFPWKCGSCGHYWWGRAGLKGFDVVHRPAAAAAAPVPVLVLTPPPATGR